MDNQYSEHNFREALKVVEARLVNIAVGMKDPELFMQLMPIREALQLILRALEKARDGK